MAVKPGTARGYTTARNHWTAFADLYGAPALLLSPNSTSWLLFFAGHLGRLGYKPGTVATYVSNLVSGTRAATGINIGAPRGVRTLLSSLLSALAVIDTRAPALRRPVTVTELWSLVDSAVALHTVLGDNIAAALLLGFFAGCRVGELTHTRDGRPAMRDDVSFLDRPGGRVTMVVSLLHFKNQMPGRPAVPVVVGDLPPASGLRRLWRCPVVTLRTLFRRQPALRPRTAPIFRSSTGPLRATDVNRFLRRQAVARGWPPEASLAHAVFRFSCATALDGASTPRALVKAHLRWRSAKEDVSLDWYSRSRITRLAHLSGVLAATAASATPAIQLASGFQQ